MGEHVGRVLDEVCHLLDGSTRATYAVAIAVEDALGITLADSEISPEALGSPEAIRATVLRHLAGA